MKANNEERKLKLANIKFRIWLKKEKLIAKILSLPIIQHILVFIEWDKKRKMSCNEQYLAEVEEQYKVKKIEFNSLIIELVASNQIQDILKQKEIKRRILLSNDLINSPNAKDLKEWLLDYDIAQGKVFSKQELDFIMKQTMNTIC